jgi:hypothetical protein
MIEDGIQFITGTPDGEIFHLLVDNGRHVMRIRVSQDDIIYVAPIESATWGSDWQATRGHIHRHDPEQNIYTEDGIPVDEFTQLIVKGIALSPAGICIPSLYSYVIPRAATLMARCYVPQVVAE